MPQPMRFDPATHVIGIDRNLSASKMQEQPDPPVPFEGLTFGVATMTENSPHGGERHPNGDEVLYLVSGRVRVVFIEDSIDDVVVGPGEGMVVPKGTWHRVDILEPSQIVYVTPGPDNEFKL